MIRRNTNQRQIVYDSLRELGHASSECLINYIQKNYSNISLATIYRNLGILIDDHMVKKVKLDGVDVYETVKAKHFHYYCKCCEEVIDIIPSDVNLNFTEIHNINMDRVDDCDVVFYGICHKCQLKMNKNKKGKDENEKICM